MCPDIDSQKLHGRECEKSGFLTSSSGSWRNQWEQMLHQIPRALVVSKSSVAGNKSICRSQSTYTGSWPHKHFLYAFYKFFSLTLIPADKHMMHVSCYPCRKCWINYVSHNWKAENMQMHKTRGGIQQVHTYSIEPLPKCTIGSFFIFLKNEKTIEHFTNIKYKTIPHFSPNHIYIPLTITF